MTQSSNFKNFQTTLNQLAVKRTTVSSRFKIKAARAKARIIKPLADAGIEAKKFPPIDTEILENNIPQTDSLLQTTIFETAHPIACPIPILTSFDERENKILKKESWFTKLFSLEPKAL